MATYSREEVLTEANALAKQIQDLEDVSRYKEIEQRLNQSKKLKSLINNIKALQKQAVNFQAYGKTEALKKVDLEIDEKQAEIDAIPIVEEFKESQVVINDLLQRVTQTISDEVETSMNERLDQKQ
ncbi:RicAFT regulatory complex protein RicA family protein [Paraliobacillus salinarum]|uniref:RicAFT regulatory complex protein RicA family protein n=1 Tax=Paraliobacillus salinarum TaxID=1158996 RepID=UPI0015F65C37|nr:YlbF family regulator [Paraliobacillus salinarum]